MAQTMRAVVTVPGASGGRVEVREVQRPAAGPGQVLVKVHAAGVNRGEITALRALTAGSGGIGGVECAGEIVAVGDGVDGWRPGDAVMAHGRGAQAEYVAVDARTVMRKPPRLDWLEAAAFPNVFVTAHDALVVNGGLRHGEVALVNAASSGIGVAAIQVARWAGASRVIATSRSAAKLERLRPLGMTDGIVVDGSDAWVAQAMAATGGRGVDVIADCVGGPELAHHLKSLALDGRLVSIGRLAGKSGDCDLDFVALRRLRIIGVTFRTRTPEQTVACVQACARDLLGPLERGEIGMIVDRAFPLDAVADAHAWMIGNAQVGKILLSVG
jgi:NADPH2:quinone reductase